MTAETLKNRLEYQFQALEWVISSLPGDSLLHRRQPDKWCAHEHLAHLACYQRRFLERLEAILDGSRPTFERYRAEADPEWPLWQRQTTAEVRESLRAQHRSLVAHVGSLSDAQLAHVGVHPLFGALTVPQWIEFFLLHEAHHIYVVMTSASWLDRAAPTPRVDV